MTHKPYRKDFLAWAHFAEKLEQHHRPQWLTEGMICWAHIGINTGTEEDGKNDLFTRPVLILKVFNQNMALVAVMTSKQKDPKLYWPITAKGRRGFVILDQLRTIDLKRIYGLIDGTDPAVFQQIKSEIIKLLA